MTEHLITDSTTSLNADVVADGRFDVFSRLLKDRIIVLGTDVNDEVANYISAQMLFLESQAQGARAGEGGVPLSREVGQSSLFGGWNQPTPPTRIVEKESEVEKRLAEIDPDMLSPRDAMDLIYELRGMLQGTHKWLEE